MNELTDQQIDDLVRQTQPRTIAGGHEIDRLGLRRAEQDLLEEIMSTPVRPEADAVHEHEENHLTTSSDDDLELGDIGQLPARSTRRRRRAVASLAAAAAVLAAVAVPALVVSGRGDSKVEIRSPAAQVTQAPLLPLSPGEVPRVLIDDPAWKMDHVQNIRRYDGVESFSSGAGSVSINWRPADQYQRYYDDRKHETTPKPIEVLGQTGALFTYEDDDFTVVLPVRPGARTFFDIRGHLDPSVVPALLAKLTIVPASRWDAALPASAVRPGQEDQVAAQTLAGVPLPPGFDAEDVPSGEVSDSYEYEAAVTGAVTCRWLAQYRAARADQDEATMATVDDALSTSRNWPVLKRMNQEGAWAEVIWEYADKVSNRQPITRDEVAQALSCTE